MEAVERLVAIRGQAQEAWAPGAEQAVQLAQAVLVLVARPATLVVAIRVQAGLRLSAGVHRPAVPVLVARAATLVVAIRVQAGLRVPAGVHRLAVHVASATVADRRGHCCFSDSSRRGLAFAGIIKDEEETFDEQGPDQEADNDSPSDATDVLPGRLGSRVQYLTRRNDTDRLGRSDRGSRRKVVRERWICKQWRSWR